jgi:hypothetical protein
MLTVAILKNGQPLMARSAVRVKPGVYHCDDGTHIEHLYEDGAVELAIKLLRTIKTERAIIEKKRRELI